MNRHSDERSLLKGEIRWAKSIVEELLIICDDENDAVCDAKAFLGPERNTPEKHGRFLSNIFDHRNQHAQMYMCYSHQAMFNGPKAMQIEWQHHLDWINQNIIGLPKATDTYTVDQLVGMRMIGIYAPAPEGE